VRYNQKKSCREWLISICCGNSTPVSPKDSLRRSVCIHICPSRPASCGGINSSGNPAFSLWTPAPRFRGDKFTPARNPALREHKAGAGVTSSIFVFHKRYYTNLSSICLRVLIDSSAIVFPPGEKSNTSRDTHLSYFKSLSV
jgi:hypothetical protein